MTNVGILWFRRDLRLSDHPALEAAAAAGPVVGVFIFDETLRRPAGANRLGFLSESLQWLNRQMDSNLVIRTGRPLDVLTQLVAETNARTVFATDDHGPYGRRRDTEVGEGLASLGVQTHYIGSNYAVQPGALYSDSGTAFKLFAPFFRAWKTHGWPSPASRSTAVWVGGVHSEEIPDAGAGTVSLPPAGEVAAAERADEFVDKKLKLYLEDRHKPGVAGTSAMSPYLKLGTIHPRQLLARLGDSGADDAFRAQLAWREFYADFMFHRPDTARHAVAKKMSTIDVDTDAGAKARFEKWCTGNTGFPMVDAGMRQLVGEGWMHNRARMVAASFLVKDLHLPWQWGARFFMKHLIDGDLASNSHGWQWVAGTGSHPVPTTVFNPASQGREFDPRGIYLRRWIPEIAHLKDHEIHEPHLAKRGLPAGYKPPMVDHTTERIEALARLAAAKHT